MQNVDLIQKKKKRNRQKERKRDQLDSERGNETEGGRKR